MIFVFLNLCVKGIRPGIYFFHVIICIRSMDNYLACAQNIYVPQQQPSLIYVEFSQSNVKQSLSVFVLYCMYYVQSAVLGICRRGHLLKFQRTTWFFTQPVVLADCRRIMSCQELVVCTVSSQQSICPSVIGLILGSPLQNIPKTLQASRDYSSIISH